MGRRAKERPTEGTRRVNGLLVVPPLLLALCALAVPPFLRTAVDPNATVAQNAEEPSRCDMRVVDVAKLRAEGHAAQLAKIILTTRAADKGGMIEEPVLLRGAMDASSIWASRSAFVARFGEMQVDVTHAGSEGFEWARKLHKKDHRFILGGQTDDVRVATLSLHELDAAIRNGTISEESYCFHDVATHRPLIEALSQLTSMDDSLYMQRHGPRAWKATKRRAFLSNTELCDAVRGSAYFTMGVDGSGGPFHTHTDALLGLLVGRKRWWVSRNGSHVDLSGDEFTHGRARAIAPKMRPHQYWTCVQEAGDMIWVPQGLSHTVLNEGALTVGVSMQSAGAMSLLHRAAAKASVLGIDWLLTEGGLEPDERNRFLLDIAGIAQLRRGRGGTPLHTAVLAGAHADAARALLAHGADVDATDDEGSTPLHLAAQAGHLGMIEALLAAGAQVERLDGRHHVAIQHVTVGAGSPEALRALLAAGGSSAHAIEMAISIGEQALEHDFRPRTDAPGDGARAWEKSNHIATVGGEDGLRECIQLLRAQLEEMPSS